MTHYCDLSTVNSTRRDKCWERRLVLCRELSRSQVMSQRPSRRNPAITALAMSRYSDMETTVQELFFFYFLSVLLYIYIKKINISLSLSPV